MSSANPEQLKAIQQKTGNVLLSAGAGSGKTFVIKEHLVFLIKSIMTKATDRDDLSLQIRSFFRGLVVMTFTNKAAGELKERIHRELVSRKEIEQDLPWNVVLDEFSYINVTTIHGFCLKLITLGVFDGINTEIEIQNDLELRNFIDEVIVEYLEKKMSRKHDLYSLFLKERKNITNVFYDIFSEPSQRRRWLGENNLNQRNQAAIIEDIVNYSSWKNIHNKELEEDAEQEKNKWYIALKDFDEKKNNFTLSLEGLVLAYNYFENINFKIPPTPRSKKTSDDIKSYYTLFKEFKDFIKSYGKHFYQFQNNSNVVELWYKELTALFRFIDKKYRLKNNYTFSDLEFYVLEGLQKASAKSKVKEIFSYFIVDEFQDTSTVQYEILNALVGENLNKVFCVGDLKQAIYGFRGGEISVFNDLKLKTVNNLSLKNNYRSLANIIKFNNDFFYYLLSNNDFQKIDYENQEVPLQKDDEGLVFSLDVNITNHQEDTKYSPKQLEEIEACALVKQIEKNKENNEVTAVLYKRLKPGHKLIKKLIDHNIGFTAQVKIPYGTDPVVSIFYHLLEYKFNKNNNEHYTLLVLNNLLKVLEVNKEISKADLQLFFNDGQSFGLYWGMRKFLKRYGISNSQYDANMKLIKVALKQSELEKVYTFLSSNINSEVSINLQYGNNCSKVVIMSTHASKGLEFENVLLGGIYTNSTRIINSNLMGKEVASFQWHLSMNKKDKFKTPAYLLEEIIDQLKDEHEDKRLFYVACTRAVKKLGWVNIDPDNYSFSRMQKNSWANLLREFQVEQKYQVQGVSIELEMESSADALTPSYYFLSNMGMGKVRTSDFQYLLPELSVTKLSQLASCPRKFYFDSICKIDNTDLECLDLKSEIIRTEEETISSKQRGIYIHEQVSQFLQGKKSTAQLDNTWLVEKLETLVENSEVVSEKEMKFNLFNYMITGIPDLVAYPKENDSVIEIWDFKTGKKDNNESQYWLQLACYAYAIFNKHSKTAISHIKLVLCYIDENKILERNYLYKDVEKQILKYFTLANSPNFFNKEKCDVCQFRNICNR